MTRAHFALIVLAASCVHEFVWQGLPGCGYQGNLRNVTGWALLCMALLGWCVLAADRFTSAVGAAIAVMSSTTAACSAFWLYAPFVTPPGGVQCSRQWSFPLLLLSALVALLVFWRWPNVRER